MAKRSRKKPARPIGTRRDYEGASAVAKRLSGESERDTAAERRLQALLRELDRFDETLEEADESPDPDLDESAPRRRWSDED
ncbi:MAG: hypothetical protein IT529_11525 [Burkholderiales bacterium]|nr:hypothetical protein [Burkholderiales bacterium]